MPTLVGIVYIYQDEFQLHLFVAGVEVIIGILTCKQANFMLF